MSTIDTTATGDAASRRPGPVKVTVYHNDDAGFLPYEDGHLLTAVTSHWLEPPDRDPVAVGDWVFHVFNADLDLLEAQRRNPGGETAFLADDKLAQIDRRPADQPLNLGIPSPRPRLVP